jgi:putative oxidoreductase
MPRNLSRWTYVILRIGAGLLFLEHGLQKLFGAFGGIGAPGATVPVASQLGVAGMLELAGGALLILGLMTRPVAVVLAVEMIVAFFLVHAPQGGWPIQNQGELALLYAAIFLFLAGNGAGPLSLDAWLLAFKAKDRRHTMGDRRARVAA